MSKSLKTSTTVGNAANAQAVREIADRMEGGTVAAYAFVILENNGPKIEVTHKAGVTEHDEGIYLALLQAMERQWIDCMNRKKQMLEPAIVRAN